MSDKISKLLQQTNSAIQLEREMDNANLEMGIEELLKSESPEYMNGFWRGFEYYANIMSLDAERVKQKHIEMMRSNWQMFFKTPEEAEYYITYNLPAPSSELST